MNFKKDLSPSNLGLKNMNDKYITIRKPLVESCGDADLFYGGETSNQGRQIIHIDKQSGKEYSLRFVNKSKGEIRLYQFREFFDDKNPTVGDEVYIEKEITDTGEIFYVDLIKNNKTTKTSSIKKKIIKKTQSYGQGYSTNQFSKKAIELHAMDVIKKFYKDEGWKIIDKSNSNPYDLEGKLGERLKFIEVKGTSGDGKSVILTNGEVNHVKNNPQKCAICVVGFIKIDTKLKKDLTEEEINNGKKLGIYDNDKELLMIAHSGEIVSKKDPWIIDDNDLVATQFRYSVLK